MKHCKTCGYIEYWGTQAQLVCPNCDERFLEVYLNDAGPKYPLVVDNTDSTNASTQGGN